jgi:hypothetical protein
MSSNPGFNSISDSIELPEDENRNRRNIKFCGRCNDWKDNGLFLSQQRHLRAPLAEIVNDMLNPNVQDCQDCRDKRKPYFRKTRQTNRQKIDEIKLASINTYLWEEIIRMIDEESALRLL